MGDSTVFFIYTFLCLLKKHLICISYATGNILLFKYFMLRGLDFLLVLSWKKVSWDQMEKGAWGSG